VVGVPHDFSAVNCKAFDDCPVEVDTARDGTVYTVYPSNCRRLVAIRPDGRVNIWQLSFFGQHGRFKLSFDHSYQLHAFGQNGEIDFVGDDVTWENLTEFVKPYLAKLPSCPSQIGKAYGHIGKKDLPEPPDEPHEGVVKFFNDARGTGVIATTRGDLKVHWSDITPREDGFCWLRRGEKVDIGSIGSTHGNSSLQHQAYEVEVTAEKPVTAN